MFFKGSADDGHSKHSSSSEVNDDRASLEAKEGSVARTAVRDAKPGRKKEPAEIGNYLDCLLTWNLNQNTKFCWPNNFLQSSLQIFVLKTFFFQATVTTTSEDPTSKRFDKSRRLFEERRNDKDNWRGNEIARKQEEQREKEMEVIKNNSINF